ncbi:MORN repeat-containing protein [Runella slithyformis DSM 19594]|uniref:MORN repeat-containing protein n=2 Tax=Runella TaxID=105 RepID=A0A7U4E8Q0_RUNSL|nr:MORN repeat-containing protein [Runella slithyformis DSM 19594]
MQSAVPQTAHFMKSLFCLLTALSIFYCAQAQAPSPEDETEDQFVCHYFGYKQLKTPKEICNYLSFRSNQHAEEVVDQILRQVGLLRNFVVVECPNTENCFATVVDGQRYIVYDGAFMKRVENATNTDWSAISIVAHEIGHHLQGHTIDGKGSRPQKELEADRFSGFVMQRMGASLDEALVAIKTLGDDKPTYSHPAKATRVEAIRQGWADAAGILSSTKKPASSGPQLTARPPQSTVPATPTRPVTVQPTQDEPEDDNVGCVAGNCDNGLGIYIHESGERYEGDFRYGKRHGTGVQFYPDGAMKYKGDFRTDQRTGYGAYYFPNGDKYVGLFLNNLPHGKGTYYYADGDRFVGIYENGKRNGQGAFYHRDGRREAGIYSADARVR